MNSSEAPMMRLKALNNTIQTKRAHVMYIEIKNIVNLTYN